MSASATPGMRRSILAATASPRLMVKLRSNREPVHSREVPSARSAWIFLVAKVNSLVRVARVAPEPSATV